MTLDLELCKNVILLYTHPPLRKNPPKIINGIISVGAKANATWRLGAIQDTI